MSDDKCSTCLGTKKLPDSTSFYPDPCHCTEPQSVEEFKEKPTLANQVPTFRNVE